MCGIFGYLGSRTDAAVITLEALKKLEYRGYDSWGVAYQVDGGQLFVEKQVGKIGDAVIQQKRSSGAAIGHTRWATHGGVTQLNAHPHLDCSGKLAVVHNGIVENYQALKEELVTKGHHFISETDSEVIVHLIEEAAKNLALKAAASTAFQRLEGLNAIVVLEAETQQIVAIKKGSSLVVGKSERGCYLASDPVALTEHTQAGYFLEDDELILFADGEISCFNMATDQEKTLTFVQLEISAQAVEKNGFPHFLLKEIHEQPGVISNFNEDITEFSRHLQQKIVFVGCGTAYHAGLIGTYLFAQLKKVAVQAYSGSEFGYWRDLIDAKTTVIFLSQSGETADIIEHAQFLKKKGFPIFCLVNRENSSLDRLADFSIHLSAGPEIAVLATKSFVAKISTLITLAAGGESAAKDLQASSQALQEILEPSFIEKYILPLAHQLSTAPHIFTIGRGTSYPIALEAALKIKEVTYLHTEGFASGELKHGVIALIEPGTPCLVFANDDENLKLTLSNAMEMKARGAYIIGVTTQADESFDWHIPVSECGIASIIPQTVISQLLAYHIAVLLGNDPDKPRNLAKSVTVR